MFLPLTANYPLTLDEAVCLLAFNDPEESHRGNWSDNRLERRDTFRRHLLRLLESGRVAARGKFGDQRSSPYNDPWDTWTGHTLEPTSIPPGAWGPDHVNWQQSKLTTSAGEYIDVRIDDIDLEGIATSWIRPNTTRIMPQKILEKDALSDSDMNRPNPKMHTTRLLSILEIIRSKMSLADDLSNWTRESIEVEARGLQHSISGNDAKAIATILLPDKARGK